MAPAGDGLRAPRFRLQALGFELEAPALIGQSDIRKRRQELERQRRQRRRFVSRRDHDRAAAGQRQEHGGGGRRGNREMHGRSRGRLIDRRRRAWLRPHALHRRHDGLAELGRAAKQPRHAAHVEQHERADRLKARRERRGDVDKGVGGGEHGGKHLVDLVSW
jgi:hypothetical protein